MTWQPDGPNRDYWRTQFGPEYDPPAMPPGWEDISWGNDVCPSYRVMHLSVYMDHPVAAEREFPETPRFSVHLLDELVDPSTGELEFAHAWDDDRVDLQHQVLVLTDDWQEVLDFVDWQLRCRAVMV